MRGQIQSKAMPQNIRHQHALPSNQSNMLTSSAAAMTNSRVFRCAPPPYTSDHHQFHFHSQISCLVEHPSTHHRPQSTRSITIHTCRSHLHIVHPGHGLSVYIVHVYPNSINNHGLIETISQDVGRVARSLAVRPAYKHHQHNCAHYHHSDGGVVVGFASCKIAITT